MRIMGLLTGNNGLSFFRIVKKNNTGQEKRYNLSSPTTEAAGTTEMESSVYEDARAESHTIETECNEAYTYVMKHKAF